MSSPPRSPVRAAALVLGVTVTVGAALAALRVPAPTLFAAVVGGTAHALTSGTPLVLPGWAVRGAQGLVGVTVGALVDLAALRRLGTEAAPVALVVLAALALSIGVGRVLAMRRDVSTVTGVFGLLPGGASGVVAVARDLGADDRVVTVVQYLRVLVVLLTMPVVTALVFRPPLGGRASEVAGSGPATDLTFVVVSLGLGLLLARWVPLSTMSLLGPLLVSAVLAAGGWFGPVSMPTALELLALALIGMQVGLRFTRASLRGIARMLPFVLALVAVVVVGTAGLGVLLSALTPVDPLTAYLATTPGGLFAVLAVAADSGTDVTYVMAVQLLRLLLILTLLPLLGRWLHRPG